jgi:kynureninase
VVAGIAGLVASTLSGRNRRAERLTGWVGHTDPYATTADPYAADWTTDNPYRSTDPTEENR